MGFQLFPSGIGWRDFSRTVDEGTFECANPRCKGKAHDLQHYRHRRARNWVTLFFVPVIPLNVCGDYVECRSCKSIFDTQVLRPNRPSSRASSATTTQPTPSPPQPTRPSPVTQAPAKPSAPSPRIVGTPTNTGAAKPAKPQSTSNLIPGPAARERMAARPISVVPGGVVQPPDGDRAHVDEARPTVRPVPTASEPDPSQMTVQRSALGGTDAPVPARPPSIWLRFENGDVVEVHRALIVGRDPAAPPEFAGDLCHAIEDTTMTVSKTHARFANENGVLRVTDLGSANGVTVSGSRGQQTLSNSDALVYAGSMVSLGALNIWVVSE